MYYKVDHCPVCSSQNFSNYIICKDHLVTQESFALVECKDCSFIFTNPRPQKAELGKYYASDQYKSHHNNRQTLLDIIYNTVRTYSLYKKANLIESLNTNKSILDVGVGTGHFLKTMQKRKWKISGVEASSNAKENAEKFLSQKLNSSIHQINGQNFDVISLWHVLEHLDNLDEDLLKLKSLLNKTGKLIIAVPNQNCWDEKVYKEYWAGYDVPRHLSHFNQHSIAKLLRKHKLGIIKTLPLKFDAYYISLLSEKYKNKKASYLTAFINGYKSNNWAKNNNNNYSSLIYIIDKK